MQSRSAWFFKGVRDGLPIALGYLAVAFTLGITARNAGFTALEATLASLTLNASAGEYVGFTLIAAGAGYFEIALMEAVANARYLLMSCALSQKLDPKTPLLHRLIIGYDVTDEIFGISIAVEGRLSPWYPFGAMAVAIPGWSLGTLMGVVMGNVLPLRIVSALSVALYGMFIAVIVPPARRDRLLAALIALSMALSYALTKLAVFQFLSPGVRIILLTVLVSGGAAALFPVREAKRDAT